MVSRSTGKRNKKKTQNDTKAWQRNYFQENENRKLCDIPEEKLNLLLCKVFKLVKKLDGRESEPAILFLTLLELKRFRRE